jgi:hypothetical protein
MEDEVVPDSPSFLLLYQLRFSILGVDSSSPSHGKDKYTLLYVLSPDGIAE